MSPASPIPDKPAGAYRILHTADWHLGKMLNEQSRDEEHVLFLQWLLEAVEQHDVDAIILAGDVFDSGNPPQSAINRYFDFVAGLFRQGNRALLAISGNHDSAALLDAPRQALRALNTHVVGALPENTADRFVYLPDSEHPQVAVAMLPFLRDRDLRLGKPGESAAEIQAQLVAGIRQRYAETAQAFSESEYRCPAIATGHLTVLGGAGDFTALTSDSERDIHIGGLGAVKAEIFPADFDYVALGHLHRPHAPDPSGRVRYAGSPIALSFSEANDTKEVRVLDVSANGMSQHPLPIPLFRQLCQLRTKVAELEKTLQAFQPQSGSLPTWVEVLVEDATLDDDLNETVRGLCEGRDFEVLKVLRGGRGTTVLPTDEDTSDDEAIDHLLDHPQRVFEYLLDQQGGQFDEDGKAELIVAFANLLEIAGQAATTDTP